MTSPRDPQSPDGDHDKPDSDPCDRERDSELDPGLDPGRGGPGDPQPRDDREEIEESDDHGDIDLSDLILDGSLEDAEAESLRRALQQALGEDLPDPIPDELFLLYDDGPPEKCGICGESLQDGRPYQIERSFRPTADPHSPRVVMEICMCRNCCGTASKDISEESMLKLQSLLSELRGWSSEECMACSRSRSACHGYSLAAMCRLDFLLAPPLLLCDECNANIHSQLSRRTREALGDFARDNIPGLPADIDMLPSLF